MVSIEPATGAVRWAQSVELGASSAFGVAVCGDSIYIAGGFWGQLLFTGLRGLASEGESDLYVAALSTTGVPRAVQGGGGFYTDHAAGVVCAGSQIFVSGLLYGEVAAAVHPSHRESVIS